MNIKNEIFFWFKVEKIKPSMGIFQINLYYSFAYNKVNDVNNMNIMDNVPQITHD